MIHGYYWAPVMCRLALAMTGFEAQAKNRPISSVAVVAVSGNATMLDDDLPAPTVRCDGAE